MKKGVIVGLLIVAVFCIGFFLNRKPKEVVRYETHIDTLIVRDTITKEVPVPKYVYVHRIDTVTVYVPVPGSPEDSTQIAVPLPIERKVFETDDYLAVVEGWKPDLVSMTLYRDKEYIFTTKTETRTEMLRPRWGVGIQAGYGYTPGKWQPYIGIGIQYNLFTW